MASTSTGWSGYDALSKAQFDEYTRANIGALHAQLLYNRGMTTPEAMQRFLKAHFEDLPDPLDLIDMARALARIQRALHDGEHITIFGDFDADGVTSASLMMRALRKLKQPGAELSYFIPHRIEDTRGVSKQAIDTIKQRGTTLLITTDCGSSDAAEITYARELGIDIIITDHHHPPEPPPQPYAMINPWRPDATDTERELCGVGIAFKLAHALFRAYGREQEVLELLDLVAIGTVGDVAQLLGENHTLVRLGLDQLNQTTNAGLKALIQIVNPRASALRERGISYMLGPRLNAAGRMQHAGIAVDLLISDDEAEAQALARQLEELNQARQQITEELMQRVREQALSQADKQIVLVYGDKAEWPEGIIGLVAGKLSEEIRRPVFVLSQGSETSRGSARSYGNFNIIEALRNRSDLFERHGGHEQAAGFTIPNHNIEALRTHLLNWKGNGTAIEKGEASDLISIATEPEVSLPSTAHKVDIVITQPAKQLTYEAYLKVSELSPFGAGNPEPVFKMEGFRLVRRWTSGPEGRHLRVRLRQNDGQAQFDGTFLRAGSQLETYKEGALVQVIFCLELSRNTVNREGKPDIWLKILSMEVMSS